MVSSRGIPTNHTVDGGSATLRDFINRTPTPKADGSFLNIIHLLLNCRLNPFLIPTRLRTIALQVNGREIASAAIPNLKTYAFRVSISSSHSCGTVDISLGGLGGLGGSSRTTTSGTAVVVRGLAGSSAATVVAGVAGVTAGGLVRRGSLLVVLV